MMEISIRKMSAADFRDVNRLSAQLGYPLSPEETALNIQCVINSKDHCAFVAVSGEKVLGWIGVVHAIMIESLPSCEINGLVIDEDFRGQGIGKLLIEHAKTWARERGNKKIRLRCNVIRTETHRFYQHLGFRETKQQKNFEIDL